MILKNLDQIGSKEFEFTIIGSGPAGITLATTLAKRNKRIFTKKDFLQVRVEVGSGASKGVCKTCVSLFGSRFL